MNKFNTVIQIIGYVGSFLVILSMLLTSLKKLRIVNLAGNFIFTIFAILTKSYPTAIMNGTIVIINIFNLIKLYKSEREYKIIECYKDESVVQLYLKSNLEDIRKSNPDFSPESDGHTNAFLICSKSTPIGIAIGKMTDANTMSIYLDYTIPSHRDFSVGKYLYKYLAENWDVYKFVFEGNMKKSDPYLEKMQFRSNGDKMELLM